jgi:hypothetical protein
VQGVRAADTRLPLFALSVRLVLGLFAVGGVAASLASPADLETLRPVAYSASATSGMASSLAQLVPPGNTPNASAAGRDMTVSWAQSVLTGGTPASGYVVRRYNTGGVEQTVLAGCSGIVIEFSCTENTVPTGTWQYTVTPVFGSWTGTSSLKSAAQVTSAAMLTFTSSTVDTLPMTLTGTVTGFDTDEAITFHLDSAAGPALVGTPATVPVGGTTAVTVTIPAGTDDSAHSVFVVGDQGTLASQSINVLQPPLLVALQMLDSNANGKVDHVSATFDKTLATYTAGTTPWTLSGVPSGGTLTSVSVSGTTATLSLAEGGGAADTAVGSFTVALAANAAGIRDAAAQTASFVATAPADNAAPVATLLQMFDADGNGKVDSVTVAFSETLAPYTAGNTPWTLTGVPSGGTLTSVAVSAATATLTLGEGAGAPDTSVGSFRIALVTSGAGIRDAAGNLTSLAASAPVDKAKPVRLSMVMNDVNGNGKVDQVAVTFSEPLATYTAGTTGWTLISVPSTGTLASVTASGATATLNVTEGAAAATTAVGAFTVTLATNAAGIRDAAGNLTSWSATAPADGAKPVLVSLNMNDVTLNGKVDQVNAVFTETLGTFVPPAVAPWTLTGVPSGGSLASVAVATTTATLTITEGAGAPDTAVGAFTLALAATAGDVQDPAGNLASFAATVPLDKAKPARVSMVMNDVNANGKVDQVAITFSETLATYTAAKTGWTLTSAPSGATLASVSASGTTATLTLTEGASAATTALGSFKITLATNAGGIRDAAANLTSWAATAPTDGAKPVLLTLNMNDATLNGKVDQITAVFTEPLGTYTAATAPWTLTGVPSGGTLASVAVAASTATLTITEGAGAADTTVGSLTAAMVSNAAGVKDAAGNLASFATTVPLDKAKPARLSMVMNDIDGNGKVDQVAMTFSEPLSTYTAGITGWTLTSPPSTATLASVSASGTTATLNLSEGPAAATTALGSFKITLAANAAGIRDAAGNPTSWASTAPTDGAKPVLLSLTMTDTNFNGKVDHATAVFSETLSAYTAGNTPWTLTGIPSNGTLASVAVATTTATLTLTEGASAADTTVGSFTIAMATNATGIRDAAGNLAFFATTAPADKAAPARLSMVMNDTNGNGRVDQLAMTFSEPLDTYTAAGTPWTFVSAPSGATFGSLTTSGSTATLSLSEGAGATNTAVGTFTIAMAANAAGIRDTAANTTTWAAAAPSDGAKPVLQTLTMTDTNFNGKVDHVTAVFSETLSAYTAGNAPWTLTGIPSGGTLSTVTVTVATATATLNFTEGAGTADTSVGSFTIAMATSATGIRDAANNLASFAATAPADGAGPVAMSVSTTGGAAVGKIEAADTLTINFSEPLAPASVPSNVTVTESDPAGAGNDTLTISGITLAAQSMGSDAYITPDAGIVDFTSSTAALSNANTTITVTVGGTCQNTGCAGIGQALVAASLSFSPATTLTDPAGRPAAGTLAAVLRIF